MVATLRSTHPLEDTVSDCKPSRPALFVLYFDPKAVGPYVGKCVRVKSRLYDDAAISGCKLEHIDRMELEHCRVVIVSNARDVFCQIVTGAIQCPLKFFRCQYARGKALAMCPARSGGTAFPICLSVGRIAHGNLKAIRDMTAVLLIRGAI